MVATLSSLSPAKFNSTVVAVKSVGLAPGIISAADRHSGNLYETLVKTSGAEPRCTLNMPFKSAYDVIGLGILKLTAFEFYLANFTDYVRAAGSTHTKWALSTSATAVAMITGWTVDLDGDLLAVVEVVPLAASAAAHPLTKSDNNALPSLASQPVMHTMGPSSVNGTVIPGLRSAGGELGQNLRVIRSDGDRYPRNAGYLGGSPRMTGTHSDPITLPNTIGLFGLNLSGGGFIQYFRQYDATTGEVTGDSGTGVSITAATGRIEPADIAAADGEPNTIGIQVMGTSSSSTHPFAVSVAATVPAT
jgi:hypothetical protein